MSAADAFVARPGRRIGIFVALVLVVVLAVLVVVLRQIELPHAEDPHRGTFEVLMVRPDVIRQLRGQKFKKHFKLELR